jgi:hypothetical protein
VVCPSTQVAVPLIWLIQFYVYSWVFVSLPVISAFFNWMTSWVWQWLYLFLLFLCKFVNMFSKMPWVCIAFEHCWLLVCPDQPLCPVSLAGPQERHEWAIPEWHLLWLDRQTISQKQLHSSWVAGACWVLLSHKAVFQLSKGLLFRMRTAWLLCPRVAREGGVQGEGFQDTMWAQLA